MDQITYALAGSIFGCLVVMATQALAEHRRFVSAKRLVKEQLWWFDFIATWHEIALRCMCERNSATHEQLDAVAQVGVTRIASNTRSSETPMWDQIRGCWVESDAQLRARITSHR